MKKITQRYLLILFSIMIFCIFLYVFFIQRESFESKLSFSNTDKWGYSEKNIMDSMTMRGKYILNQLPDVPYPFNVSNKTLSELRNIKKKQKNITPERQLQIEHEIYLDGIFDRFEATREEREQMTTLLQSENDPIIMNLKNKYDRVLPYKLDKTIQPSISPPQHPSYPSGHATQAYFIALLLSEKRPEKGKLYMRTAENIAINREYAGVHYRSDTTYGREIAEKLYKYFDGKKNPLMNMESK